MIALKTDRWSQLEMRDGDGDLKRTTHLDVSLQKLLPSMVTSGRSFHGTTRIGKRSDKIGRKLCKANATNTMDSIREEGTLRSDVAMRFNSLQKR